MNMNENENLVYKIKSLKTELRIKYKEFISLMKNFNQNDIYFEDFQELIIKIKDDKDDIILELEALESQFNKKQFMTKRLEPILQNIHKLTDINLKTIEPVLGDIEAVCNLYDVNIEIRNQLRNDILFVVEQSQLDRALGIPINEFLINLIRDKILY